MNNKSPNLISSAWNAEPSRYFFLSPGARAFCLFTSLSHNQYLNSSQKCFVVFSSVDQGFLLLLQGRQGRQVCVDFQRWLELSQDPLQLCIPAGVLAKKLADVMDLRFFNCHSNLHWPLVIYPKFLAESSHQLVQHQGICPSDQILWPCFLPAFTSFSPDMELDVYSATQFSNFYECLIFPVCLYFFMF